MKVKFLGQNCFLFSYKGKNILTDPFYNFQKEKSEFDISSQKIDFVLITHAHGDHTADVAEVIKNYPEAQIIAQPEICGYFGHPNSIDINIGGSTMIEDLKVSMVSASHTSSFLNEKQSACAGEILRFYCDDFIFSDGYTAPKHHESKIT